MGISSAQAADLPVEAPVAPPPAPMVYDWTGFYVGGHLGYGWGKADLNTSTIGFWEGASGKLKPDGFLGGVQTGYWWQTGGGFVFGLDGSYTWIDGKDSRSISFVSIDGPVTFEANSRISSLALIQARLGWASGRWLFFGQGGYAGLRGKARASVSSAPFPFVGLSVSDKNWHNGWTLGAGTAYKVSQNFSIGAEYNYIDGGSKDYNWSIGGGGFVNNDPSISVFKITGNYHFNLFGGP
jgi:opacity protein-like surface antigen